MGGENVTAFTAQWCPWRRHGGEPLAPRPQFAAWMRQLPHTLMMPITLSGTRRKTVPERIASPFHASIEHSTYQCVAPEHFTTRAAPKLRDSLTPRGSVNQHSFEPSCPSSHVDPPVLVRFTHVRIARYTPFAREAAVGSGAPGVPDERMASSLLAVGAFKPALNNALISVCLLVVLFHRRDVPGSLVFACVRTPIPSRPWK